MLERLIEYEDSGVRLEGLLVCPDGAGGARPGVVISHAWGGRGEVEAGWARRLAAEGYAAFALDMFGKGVRGSNREENAALIGPFLQDRAMLQKRINAAVNKLRDQPEVESEKVAAIGFCFGGLCVLDLARSGADVRGVVSLHGLFTPPDPLPGKPIVARILALHGHDDPMAPPEAVLGLETELTEAGVDWQVHVYGGTMHAFTNPGANDPDFGTVYSATAERRAWIATTSFLAEVLA